jgi:hypothetical protein
LIRNVFGQNGVFVKSVPGVDVVDVDGVSHLVVVADHGDGRIRDSVEVPEKSGTNVVVFENNFAPKKLRNFS